VNNLWLILLAGVVFILLGIYAVELPFMMNYLEVKDFWRRALLLGSGTGLALATWATFRDRGKNRDSVSRMRQFSAILISSVLLVPLLISVTNHWVLQRPAVPQAVVFETELPRNTSRFGNIPQQHQTADQYILIFVWNNRLYRVSRDHPYFPTAQTGDTVNLPIRQGRWGYHWVAETP
jgi:hypothetical protein